MSAALDAARLAESWSDVPVGAAVFRGSEIVAVGSNERERTGDPTAHAEIVAIRRAAVEIGSWNLTGLAMAVTLEPCAMCAGAIVNARLDRLIIGAADLKAGAVGSLYNICQDARLNHELDVAWDVRADECGALLKNFFRTKRP